MHKLNDYIDNVYKIDCKKLADYIERELPHYRVSANDWGQIELKNDLELVGTITIPDVDLHNEVVYVSGDVEIANTVHTILDGLTKSKIAVRYINTIPKIGVKKK